jgi:hemerythrin-like metal-binding protein
MTLAPWKPAYELGLAPMDDTHREFIDWLNKLDVAADDEFLAGLDEFIAHTQAHFDQEDRWMRGSGFPPVECHGGMHVEILKIAQFVREQVAKGNMTMGRQLVKELVPWFDDHAATMDSALAAWINQTEYKIDATPKAEA